MDVKAWCVFLDSSVLISGVISQTGASSAILDLAEAGEIRIILSQSVLIETDRVFERKFPILVDQFREFIKNLAPVMMEDPTPEEIREAEHIIADKDDAPVLAAVKKEDVQYLITLDTKHFHSEKVRRYLKAAVVTPSQFLTQFRDFYEKQE